MIIIVQDRTEIVHEFGALNTLLFVREVRWMSVNSTHICHQVIVLGLCIVCAYLIKVYRFYYLPESGAAMLVGLIVGACARVFYPSRKEMEILRFNVSCHWTSPVLFLLTVVENFVLFLIVAPDYIRSRVFDASCK